MADSAELAFVKKQLETIGRLPIQYGDDYLQPPTNSLKKVPIVPLELPPPPKPMVQEEAQPAESVNLVFKVAKPPNTFSLSVSSADTISSIKSKLAAQPGAPPADAQRLLLRGKALADNKLLKEYAVKDGDTVNLMLRPGFEWDWNAETAVVGASPLEVLDLAKDKGGDVQMKLTPEHAPPKMGRHGRIPSVILSPSPSLSPLPNEDLAPIPLSLDADLDTHKPASPTDPYYQKISSPGFWDRLHKFLESEFQSPKEADEAFEAFLIGSKGFLSPHDIANIRDAIGILGMNGT